MMVGGFLGFLGLFLSAFVSQMELWILTYGVISGLPFRSVVVFCYLNKLRNISAFISSFMKSIFHFRSWIRLSLQSMFHCD